ncbi:DUF1810 domain-containing protein [Flavisphingomonas formosensis]|uniref:DUF1810 domain-containing protein n=1 Tax=Flavisphingomonas formosensis TaxID=861534 RepID=UPI001E40097A|nr:DUF1810 domain-containing protein [Sphingomonas formosensis]
MIGERSADGDGLVRFVAAQDGSYARALEEIRAGRKQSHWMWYVFPQIAGLGSSPMAQRYAIRDLAEARAYLAHPLLGGRLIEIAGAALGWVGERSADAIFGAIDAVKLRSCCTLFEAVAIHDGRAGSDVFARCLDGFYAGDRDPATLARIA